MREIFPIENKRKKELDAINKEQQLYDDLVERINELSANLSNYEETTDAAIAAFSSAITTVILNATNITSETLSTDVINALSETVSNLVASNIHTTSITVDTLIDAAVATFNKITSDEATFRDIHITGDLTLDNVLDLDKLNVNEFVINSLEATSANISNFIASVATITTLNATTENVDVSNITEANIAEANITETDITKAEIDDATIQSIQNTKLAQVVLAEADDYYVEIPGNLINGTYDVIAFDNSNNQLWAVSVHNDIAGHFIWTWTTIDTNYLQTFYTKNNKLYIKAKTNNRVNKICYKNNSYDKVLAPQIYDTFVVDDATEWRIQSLAGSWFTGYLNAEHNGNTTTAIAELQLMPVTDVADADDSTVIYNGDVAKTYKTYHPDQNVDKASDVEFATVKISGLDGDKYLISDTEKNVAEVGPVDLVNGEVQIETGIQMRQVANANTLTNWNGSADNNGTKVYPITKLGTVDHGEWDAGNVTTPKAVADTLIGGNKNFYAGEKLAANGSHLPLIDEFCIPVKVPASSGPLETQLVQKYYKTWPNNEISFTPPSGIVPTETTLQVLNMPPYHDTWWPGFHFRWTHADGRWHLIACLRNPNIEAIDQYEVLSINPNGIVLADKMFNTASVYNLVVPELDYTYSHYYRAETDVDGLDDFEDNSLLVETETV